MSWITENWAYICSGLFGLVVLATIIVKFTPTTKDDSVMHKIISFIDHFSLAKTADDKALIEVAKHIDESKKEEAK